MAAQRRMPPDAKNPAFMEGGVRVCGNLAGKLYRTAMT
jgi:hypothetical protein